MKGGDDGGGLRAEREGDSGVRYHVRLADFCAAIIHAEHGDGGAQDVHRASVLGRVFQKIGDRCGQRTLSAELYFKGVQLGLVRQTVVME